MPLRDLSHRFQARSSHRRKWCVKKQRVAVAAACALSLRLQSCEEIVVGIWRTRRSGYNVQLPRSDCRVRPIPLAFLGLQGLERLVVGGLEANKPRQEPPLAWASQHAAIGGLNGLNNGLTSDEAEKSSGIYCVIPRCEGPRGTAHAHCIPLHLLSLARSFAAHDYPPCSHGTHAC
jgi:hypothetical protein